MYRKLGKHFLYGKVGELLVIEEGLNWLVAYRRKLVKLYRNVDELFGYKGRSMNCLVIEEG